MDEFEMKKDEALKLARKALSNRKAPAKTIYEALIAIDAALAQPEQHQDWCASLTKMLTSMPPKRAPCNCKLAQPEQEPAAWMYADDLKRFETSEAYAEAYSIEMVSPTQGETVPLYTAPPQRTWVGLEDEDVATVKNDFNRGALWAEAKLKEKNA